MKIKLTLWTVLTCVILSSGFKSDSKKNVVKLNLFALGAQNISLQYERAFTRKSSASLGFSFMPSRSLPVQLTGATNNATLQNMTLSGFTFTPEYRWYPGTNKGAPAGFYLAPYLRYSNYTLNSTISFSDGSGNTFTNPISATYGGTGIGVMIGAQWLIKGRFSIDWWMLGGHYGVANASFKVLGDFSTYAESAHIDLKKQLDAITVPYGTSSGEVTTASAGLNWVGPFVGFRTGLALGWAF